jgi:HTH-type transcriptional regulator, cell division transcriptional repressor
MQESLHNLFCCASMDIAKIIREGREKLNLNQSQLAERVGVSPQAVQQWESGTTQPRGKRLNKIAEVLKLPPALLHFGGLPAEPKAEVKPAGTEETIAGTQETTPAAPQPEGETPAEPSKDAAESPPSSNDALIQEVIAAMQRMSKEDASRLVTISKALVGEESKEAAALALKPLPVPDLAPHPPPAFPPRRMSPTSNKTRGKTAI